MLLSWDLRDVGVLELQVVGGSGRGGGAVSLAVCLEELPPDACLAQYFFLEVFAFKLSEFSASADLVLCSISELIAALLQINGWLGGLAELLCRLFA